MSGSREQALQEHFCLFLLTLLTCCFSAVSVRNAVGAVLSVTRNSSRCCEHICRSSNRAASGRGYQHVASTASSARSFPCLHSCRCGANGLRPCAGPARTRRLRACLPGHSVRGSSRGRATLPAKRNSEERWTVLEWDAGGFVAWRHLLAKGNQFSVSPAEKAYALLFPRLSLTCAALSL